MGDSAFYPPREDKNEYQLAMVNVVAAAASLGGSAAEVNQLGPKVGSRPALVLYSSDEPGELSYWLFHSDSTIRTLSVTIHHRGHAPDWSVAVSTSCFRRSRS